MSKNILLLCLLALLSSTTCERKHPEPTKDGLNTFGCYVNGEEFNVKGQLGNPPTSTNIELFGDREFLAVIGHNYKTNLKYVTLRLSQDSLKKGTRNFILSEHPTYIDYKAIVKAESWGGIYYKNNQEAATGAGNSGEVKISKYDTINRIISGTFYFNARHQNGEIIEVSNGKFDMKY